MSSFSVPLDIEDLVGCPFTGLSLLFRALFSGKIPEQSVSLLCDKCDGDGSACKLVDYLCSTVDWPTQCGCSLQMFGGSLCFVLSVLMKVLGPKR